VAQTLNQLATLTVSAVDDAGDDIEKSPKTGGSLLGKLGNIKSFVPKKKVSSPA
jgi:hypothetical protein